LKSLQKKEIISPEMEQKKLPFHDEITIINSLSKDELKVALLATFRGYTPWQGLRLALELKKLKTKKGA